MQVRCVRAHGRHRPGEIVEVPDGAEVSDLYWRVVPGTAAQVPQARTPAGEPGGGQFSPRVPQPAPAPAPDIKEQT